MSQQPFTTVSLAKSCSERSRSVPNFEYFRPPRGCRIRISILEGDGDEPADSAMRKKKRRKRRETESSAWKSGRGMMSGAKLKRASEKRGKSTLATIPRCRGLGGGGGGGWMQKEPSLSDYSRASSRASFHRLGEVEGLHPSRGFGKEERDRKSSQARCNEMVEQRRQKTKTRRGNDRTNERYIQMGRR